MSRVITAIALLMLTVSASAQRTLEIVEYAIEAPVLNVVMPAGPTGVVTVSAGCDGCTPRTLIADGDTLYYVRDTPVPHAEFMQQLQAARAGIGEAALVGVYFDPESQRATRFRLVRSAANN